MSKALKTYLTLSSLFIAALVSCNLIFQKFFVWQPLAFLSDSDIGFISNIGKFKFELSVGILPYPITFLITDIISEIFGRKRANQTVLAGFFAAAFMLLIVVISDAVPATSWSPVDGDTFHTVFGLTPAAVGASMAAYLLAQLIDVRVFHFWKKLTNGKMLWVRNNFSTMVSQMVDTATVLLLLCLAGVLQWSQFWTLFGMGFLFKILIAAIDTPLLYLAVFLFRKSFHLRAGEEIKHL